MASMDVDANAVIPVVIKHQGKSYKLDVDTSEPGSVFKYQVYSLTNVQPENQKILCRAHQVKDDTDLSTLRLKPGQVIMVLGQPGEAPSRFEAPKEKTRFVEDMSARELAQSGALATPVGLVNLGNTCYLNASLQVMRSIPEIQDGLVNHYHHDPQNRGSALTGSLRAVFAKMSATGEAVQPSGLLNVLRAANARFAERSPTGAYAQQDAEEAWTFLINSLRETLLVADGAEDANPTAVARMDPADKASVIDRYLAGQMQRVTVCDEEAGNPPEAAKPELNKFRVLDCHINESINHLRDGLLAGLVQHVEKTSDLLGRPAAFTSTDRIAQLPKYLSIHLLRFSWKRAQQLSTKILRKVSFPLEIDLTEMCTDELRDRILPVREKVRELTKEIDEMERSKKKRKRRLSGTEAVPAKATSSTSSTTAAAATATPEETFKTDAELETEKQAAIDKGKEELYELVAPQLATDRYANHSGLYQLRAVLTHQGARSDSGHYTAYVKKSAIYNPISGQTAEDDGSWLWFNDDTVTEVTADRVEALAGGGPSHAAFMLLYASVPLPLPASRLTGKFSQS